MKQTKNNATTITTTNQNTTTSTVNIPQFKKENEKKHLISKAKENTKEIFVEKKLWRKA